MQEAPLAWRMRPRALDDFIGQTDAVGPGSLLRTLIEEDALVSIIIWGPPGVGKTSLAMVVSEVTSAYFEQLSAVTSGVADLRKAIEAATARLAEEGRRTIVLVDEIHRFNKAQQDALLPAVEDGRIVLIGTTTENPYFEVNSALLSRSRLIRLEPLSDSDLSEIIDRALADTGRGIGGVAVVLDDDARAHIIRVSKGDARVALSVLEAATEIALAGEAAGAHITLGVAEEGARVPAVHYDKEGDVHYDVISAFIKSMRGSDPDAALYWLARMIAGGEDPRFIARRIVIFASEDIGLADSGALPIAAAAAQAVETVGLPEARINLAHAVVYLAMAPKSNSAYRGIDKALADVKEERDFAVPTHLRDAHYPGAKKLGHGAGYKYPHSFPTHWVEQEYLPARLKDKKYYEPGTEGEEPQRYRAFMNRRRRADSFTRRRDEKP